MNDELKLLGEWKALSAAATEGPWFADGRCLMHDVRYDDFDYRASLLEGTDGVDVTGWCEHWADADFIAASRTIVPRLLAVVEAVLDEHPRYEGDFSDFCGHCQARGEGTWPCPTITALRAVLIGDDDE